MPFSSKPRRFFLAFAWIAGFMLVSLHSPAEPSRDPPASTAGDPFREWGVILLAVMGTSAFAGGIGFVWQRSLQHLVRQRTLELGDERDFSNALLQTAPSLILVTDGQGRIRRCNRFAETFTGYDQAQLVGRPLWAYCAAPEAETSMKTAFAAIFSRGAATAAESQWRMRDGSHRTLNWSYAPMTDARRTEYVIAIGTDITERKLSENRLKLAASVFRHAYEGIIIADDSGNIVETNDTFCQISGYSRDEVIGNNPRFLKSGRHDPHFYAELWHSLLSTGFWRGEIWNRRKDGRIYAQLTSISAICDEAEKVTHYVGLVSDITVLKESQQNLERMAYYDPLTRLPNRVLLADRMQLALAQAQRSGALLAVAYLDLDGFKPVNDTLGHKAGDSLLVEVAERLGKCVRAGDTVARLGGDEFVLLICGLSSGSECEAVLARLLARVDSPFEVAGHEIRVTASVGVTLFPQEGGADSDALLRQADQAMYMAKQAGRNRYHFFEPERDRRRRDHQEALSRIGKALDDQEFRLYYQPKVDILHGTVIGVEALIRWQHPERGILPPCEFLPFVENDKLAIAIGEWVLQEAVCQIQTWLELGHRISVSVNIAARHLEQPDFVAKLEALLARYPLVDPACLEMEILETATLDDIAQVSELIEACRALGVGFALDDFGTGYSSLTYLKRLPVKTLKIDRSFVRDMLEDMEDRAIVEGVIGLANAFRRVVIAEGVETLEHGKLLLQLGCDYAQGFGIARPMPADRVIDWIEGFEAHPVWMNQ
jgi:diguanylate cyclase (GGDEF)-like protein/PAS domain S-box-containing protein